MPGALWTILITSAEESFTQVTVFVGAVLLLFGYIDYKQQGAFIEIIAKSKRFQPLIGALLGIIPGCGGSILVMPLYVKGTVTFGTVVATLIATAGDSAFVTLTQIPGQFALITGACLVIGAAAGYAVDYYKMGDWVRQRSAKKELAGLEKEHEKAEAGLDRIYSDHSSDCRSRELRHIGHEEGDEIDMLLHHAAPLDPRRLGYRITHNFYVVFWVAIAVGLVLGVLGLMQVDPHRFPRLPGAGALIGGAGTLIVLLYMLFGKRFIQAQTHEDAEHKLFSLKETFIHNAQETAFVGTWVFAAYLVFELAIYFGGGEKTVVALLASTGFVSVMLGVLVGIIPGCGPQVIFVSLYLKGMFPFAALLANAVSQDGDALFPLIAMDRKAAFWATVVNTAVAAVVGIIAYFIEMGLG